MSCMKASVCTEPSIEIVNHKDEISSRCTVQVSGVLVMSKKEQHPVAHPVLGLAYLIFALKPRPVRH